MADLNKYLSDGNNFNGWLFCIEVIAVLSPVVFVLFIALLQKCNWCKARGFSSVGDLFKRNSVDRIEETWLVNKEIGAIELSKALEGFTSESVIGKNRFILIIDNLDRVNADKVKELWSDMELISGATHNNFRIVVPYSARQVSASLDLEGYSGREFIAKRIPVCFHVPPLISAGWQEAFHQFWKETVSEDDESSCREVATLLERWKPAEYPRITPRLMKKFVNDIHVIDLTISAEENHRHILIALYLLVVKYADIDIKRLLRKANDENSSDGMNIPPDEIDTKLSDNFQQLSRIFGDNANRWSEFLMCIHYQTNIEIARSELLDEPLIQAINTHSESKLEELLSLWGFSQSWNRISTKINIIDWIITLSKLPEKNISFLKEQIEISIQSLNVNYARNKKEYFNENFVKSLIKVNDFNFIKNKSFIERQIDYIVHELNYFNGKKNETYDDNAINELLSEANLYSIINKSSLLKLMNSDITGDFYAMYLSNKASDFNWLSISDIDLSDENKKMMLINVINNPHGNIFSPSIIKHIGLCTSVVNEISSEFNFEQSSSALNMLYSGNVGSKEVFRKIIFNREWRNQNIINYYNSSAPGSISNEEYAAQAIAHMIEHDDFRYINNYDEFIKNSEFEEHMHFYLLYASSFEKVIDKLRNETVLKYISGSVKKIINNDEISCFSLVDYIGEEYELVKNNILDSQPMVPVKNRMEYIVANIEESELIKLGRVFLKDLFLDKDVADIQEKLFELSSEVFHSEEKLISAFFNLHENQITIFKNMKETKKVIHMNENIAVFSDWYRKADENDLNNAENIHFLWSLLEDEQRKEIINQLHDVLLERNVSISNRTKIIHHFGDNLKFKELEGREDRRGVAALFNASLEDDVLREWLNQQEFNFSKWSQDDQNTATICILDNQDKFPEICKKSQLIQNKIKEDKAKKDKAKKENPQDSEDIAES